MTVAQHPTTRTTAAAPLALHDVRAGYGRIEVLHGIDIAVERGAVTADSL